jgi:hypothetical protein
VGAASSKLIDEVGNATPAQQTAHTLHFDLATGAAGEA